MTIDDSLFAPVNGFPRYLACREGFVINTDSGHILRGGKKKSGYVQVILCDEDHKPHTKLLHRIIAEAFCEQEDGETEVNHKNGIKDDNRADNLEWVTRSENLEHAYREGLMPNDATPKSVIAVSTETGEQMAFPSIYSAARFLGISQGNICMCCKGERPYAGGYYWRYAE